MVKVTDSITKVCCFYASDWHFVTMLLPHVNKSINEGNKITTILEKDSQNKVKTLLEKLKLKNEKKILEIDWTKKEINSDEVEKILRKRGEKPIEIIISGNLEYIDNANDIIEQYIYNNQVKRKIKIIDCYYIEEENLNVKEILNKHDMVINTAGEKNVDSYVCKIKN